MDIASNFQIDDLQQEDRETQTTMSADQQKHQQNLFNALMDMEGDKFQESFINRMVEENQALIDEFEQAKGSVENEELSRWIDNTLPSLKDHLSKAQDLQTKLENGELENNEGGLFDR
jgi:predicted outer membrane protein